MTGPFALDKENAKWMGVCAGFARWSDLDVTIVRVGLVLLSLMLGPLTLIGYLVTGSIAPKA
jgi:phage shock protein C